MSQQKQAVYQQLIPLIRIWEYLSWYFYLNTNDSINLIIGAGSFKFKGWISTDIATLDVTNENHFKKYFKDKKINKIFAEHVLEHLTSEDLESLLHLFGFKTYQTIFTYGFWGDKAGLPGILYPMLMLNKNKLLFILLPFYYILTLLFTFFYDVD